MKKLGIIVGCRPNYVKAAALVKEFERREKLPFAWYIGVTGQHHDDSMSYNFAKYFKIGQYIQTSFPYNDHGWICDDYTPAVQLSSLIYKADKIIQPGTDAVMVLGDVDSSAAAALAARRMKISVYHYEAGLRCGDMNMVEEQNRVIIDTLADEFFITEQSGYQNLFKEGKSPNNIHFVGDIMVDVLMEELARDIPRNDGKYGVLTLHRAENVDDPDVFWRIIKTMGTLPINFIYPVHPRVRNRYSFKGYAINLDQNNILTNYTMGYSEFIRLCRNAQIIITDSGGVQTEAMVMGVPCITLRDVTEKLCTIEAGGNYLAGNDPELIKNAFKLMVGKSNSYVLPRGHDGKAAKRTVDILEKLLA